VSDEQIFNLEGDGAGATAILWPAISPTPMMLRLVEEMKTSSAEYRSSGRRVCSTSVDAGFGADFGEDAAGDAFEAAGV